MAHQVLTCLCRSFATAAYFLDSAVNVLLISDMPACSRCHTHVGCLSSVYVALVYRVYDHAWLADTKLDEHSLLLHTANASEYKISL